ncbi:uncharacterized protein Z520_06037 [Fonsecaea multimorphosa CBS 102226]|uniref:F-box domain-containing protein n=1 Tax=Fonsecaea multimorphosa CBS 102226 TaxID=1442371 RepID=A0A0D2K459_9EURO|nr:uncharacterized protein Z520_06037 [Fonsecaea multimorphosa CBS 102226]KIX97959.1 hypothetical protein Z520_06037 [Fonsecaea multimorphosa CBS 102226]OAL24332.1 hypothetical protein AYO22_05708 [Fonsecaea multimorphosa]
MPGGPGHVVERSPTKNREDSHVPKTFDPVEDATGPSNVNGVARQTNTSEAKTSDQSNDVPIHYVNNVAWRRQKVVAENEPLVDTTAALALHSKKTARLQRRQQKKQARKVHSDVHSFLDLPQELLSMILSFLQPTDIVNLLLLNKSMHMFILDNERSIADDIMNRRYWTLRQCFPPPVSLDQVPSIARPALMNEQRQGRGRIHKIQYQHIKQIDSSRLCTCVSCVLSWNNLNIILDLAYWQKNLENREPLPVIPPGRNPDWNVKLLDRHAAIVAKATKSPLTHARILQMHLDTTIRTIIRFGKWEKKGDKARKPESRLYHLTDAEAAAGTDEFLDRKGPPSYQPLYMRDNYYTVGAFVPQRKWDIDDQKWYYYAKWPLPHENDLNWIVARFTPKS